MNEPSRELNNGHENNARTSLQSFLDNNYELVRAMRARVQHQDAGGNNDSAQMMQLTESIKSIAIEQQVFIENYRLCQISGDTQEFSHGGSKKFARTLDPKKSIRGFYFRITLKDQSFECVVLDPDNTRQYFDSKTTEQKRQFVQRFADRDRTKPFYNQKFVAFLTQLDLEKKFKIEEMVVSAKPPSLFIEDA